jgi:hypothetical protein
LVYLFDLTSHISQIIVFCPPSKVFFESFLALCISYSIASRSDGLETTAHLGFTLLMEPQTAFAVAYIEAVPKKL